ncbi:hypothetical protein JTB14_003443 [Gonioctena quinquepunctata]|nr:hypothetical protein JTB14_003443 [Gonioctena quinquepunctata]
MSDRRVYMSREKLGNKSEEKFEKCMLVLCGAFFPNQNLRIEGISSGKIASRTDKYYNEPLLKQRDATPLRQRFNQDNKANPKAVKKPPSVNLKLKPDGKSEIADILQSSEHKITHRSSQTERTDNIDKIFETGVIRYPSVGLERLASSKQGDHGDDLEGDIQSLEIEDKDFVKGNMSGFKPKTVKQLNPKVPAQAPPTYQRGVVPKYIRDKKTDKEIEEEEGCPPGHVLLPEEERKETLRVLRQSYADRIQELNSMPVRSDTLRVKKRKMEIEEELKRIDGGIKVFQRPKVYVKVDA